MDVNQSTNTLIIGAGPSGLAVGAELRRHGVPFEIIERASELGSSWRNHYRRLHLHTVKALSNLPGLPFGPEVGRYPSRQQVVRYLERYADHFGLDVHTDETVLNAERIDGHWRVQTDLHHWSAEHLVVATGYNRTPHRPKWPGLDDFTGVVAHSSDYADGAPYHGQRVIVVGAGNSGAEIAVDLCEHGAQVNLCIRGPIHVVARDSLGISAQRIAVTMRHLPVAVADRLAMPILKRQFGDLSPYGIVRPAKGPGQLLEEQGRVPLVDIGTIALIKQGAIRVIKGLQQFHETSVTCVDGTTVDVDAVILATGYRPTLAEFLPAVDTFLNARGYPTVRQSVANKQGLHFLGFTNPITGALREIAIEARAVAARIGALS